MFSHEKIFQTRQVSSQVVDSDTDTKIIQLRDTGEGPPIINNSSNLNENTIITKESNKMYSTKHSGVSKSQMKGEVIFIFYIYPLFMCNVGLLLSYKKIM